jgi:fumarate reductase flavoprotein subunit
MKVMNKANNDFSRRAFIKNSAAAGVGASLLVGIGAKGSNAEGSPSSGVEDKYAEQLAADVVVIGSGACGLTAASAAVKAGAKNVLVLEKAEELGGNTRFCGGMFAVDSPIQKRLGIKVSADEMFREKMEISHWRTDPWIVHLYIQRSGDIVGWLEGLGLKFYSLVSTTTKNRCLHQFIRGYVGPGQAEVGMGTLVEVLKKSCADLGVKIISNTAVKSILTDKDGKVNGVSATRAGKQIRVSAKGVIIATGGFGGSKEMIERFFPGLGNAASAMQKQCSGDGILLADKFGATTSESLNISLMGEYVHEFPKIAQITGQGLSVNRQGVRYIPLGLSQDDAANVQRRQPGDKVCFSLMDAKMVRDALQTNAKASNNAPVEYELENSPVTLWETMGTYKSGATNEEIEAELKKAAKTESQEVKISDSLDEIGKWIGAKPGVLKDIVEQYNSYCDKGYDPDFLVDKEQLVPLREPPYLAAAKKLGLTDTSMGGVMVSRNMEVINGTATPVLGLYAGGDVASGWVTPDYGMQFAGSALMFALVSGDEAGKSAAKYIQEA